MPWRYLCRLFYLKRSDLRAEIKGATYDLNQFWFKGWGFDALYDILFVQPYVFLSKINKNDFLDGINKNMVASTDFFNQVFARTQSGIMRWYIMGIVVGAVLILSLGLIMH